MKKKLICFAVLALCAALACARARAWVPEYFFDTAQELPSAAQPLVPGDETYLSGFGGGDRLAILTALEDGLRRAYICEKQADGSYALLAQSAPLAPRAGIEATIGHMGDDNLFLFFSERNYYCFLETHAGAWVLGQFEAGGNDMVDISACKLVEYRNDGERVAYGETPVYDLATFDTAALPEDFDDALAATRTDGWAVVRNPDRADRLHLRERPDKASRSLGRYYNGTPVRVLGTAGDYAHVSVAGVEGYMMRSYLAMGEEAAAVNPAFLDYSVREEADARGVSLYEKPDGASALAGVLFSLKANGWRFDILGVTDDGWYHILCFDGLSGYASAEDFWPGNG